VLALPQVFKERNALCIQSRMALVRNNEMLPLLAFIDNFNLKILARTAIPFAAPTPLNGARGITQQH